MVWIGGPSVLANSGVKALALNRLDVARVAGPAYAGQVVYIIKQFQVTLMWLDVVNDCGSWACPATLEHSVAALVLAGVLIPEQNLFTQNPPLLLIVKLSILGGFWASPFVHQFIIRLTRLRASLSASSLNCFSLIATA